LVQKKKPSGKIPVILKEHSKEEYTNYSETLFNQISHNLLKYQ